MDTYSRQGKLAYVHFRNVRGKVPHYKETFIDDGDVDMLRVLRILKRERLRRACSSPTTRRRWPAPRRGTPAWPTRWATCARRFNLCDILNALPRKQDLPQFQTTTRRRMKAITTSKTHSRLFPIHAITLASCLATTVYCGDSAVITHITDPAMPGKLSVVVGDGWDNLKPGLKIMTLPNSSAGKPGGAFTFSASKAQDIAVIKNAPQTLICELPPGKFAVQAIAASGPSGWGEPVVVNRARIQWLSKESAPPGGLVRAIGRNLVNLDLYPRTDTEGQPAAFGDYLREAQTSILIQKPGEKFVRCEVHRQSAYDVHFALPSDLPEGAYKVYAHNGLGGRYGWSEPVELTVKRESPWPTQVLR